MSRFRHLSETFLPENLGEHCQKWPAGKTDAEINEPTSEREVIATTPPPPKKKKRERESRPQDILGYTDGSVRSKVLRSLRPYLREQSQGPVRVGFHLSSKVRPPTVQCSDSAAYTQYSLNLHLDNGGRSRLPCPPFDCFKR